MRRDIGPHSVRIASVALLGLCVVGCNAAHYGTYPDGLKGFPDRPVSPAQAVEAARPYLDQTCDLCRAPCASNSPEPESQVRVKLDGNCYKVLKYYNPSLNSACCFCNAVKVNAETGEVTPPK